MEAMETTGLEPAELDEGSPPPLEIFETTTPQLPDTTDDGHPTATTTSQQAVEYEPITPVTGSPTNFDGVMMLGSQPLFTSEALITLISQQESVGTSEETGGETLTLISQQQSVGPSDEAGDETLTLISQQEPVGPSEETGDETLTLISQQESVGPSEETGGETSTQHLQGETAALRPGDEGETGTQAGGQTAVPGGETAVPGGETAVPGGETAVPGGETAVPGGETAGAPSVSGETASQAAEQPRTESSSDGPGGRTDTNPKPSASVPGWKPSASPAAGLKKMEKVGGPEKKMEKVGGPEKKMEKVGGPEKKMEKVGGPLPRRYFPGKRPLDPLKMDMSKPVVMPLSSSQMSLQCLECHIIFSDSKSMERHLKLNHPARYEQCILREALFACYVCDRHFTNSTELMVHQKAHVEKKPFKCPLCSQAFKKSSELTLHKKVHFGEGGYACTDCGKPCKTLTLLKYHRRTHTGETPYVCRECGARFSQTKALQKHQLCHDSEAPQAQEAPPQQQPKKKAIKYPCSACKAVFRTAKGRGHHMKTKHSASLPPPPAGENNGLRGAPQSAVPTITPISICQPSLLQMESMGPLQKVDSNMDTELICKLIESMGNVQRVNQVVVLGQVVPTPLSGHNLAMPAAQGEAASVNVTSPSVAVVLDPGQDSSLEHTIILEPITPDGQLINPPFARAETAGELMMRSLLDDQPDTAPCRGDAADHLARDPEQTVVLELTSVLMPSTEFEQSRPEAASSLIPTKDLEDSHQAGTVPPLIPTGELLEQQDLSVSTCAFMTADTPPHLPGEPRANPEEETLTSDLAVESQADPETQTTLEDSGSRTQATARTDGLKESAPLEEEPHKINGAETSGTAQSESEGTQEHRQSVAEADKDETPHPPPQTEAKRAEQASAPPVNVMSAQELVKVRKRKTQLAGPMYSDYYWLSEQPIKRQRTKKSVLVVKFGPKKKEKRSKGPRKTSQACQSSGEEPLVGTSPKRSEKKAALKKRGRKAKKASKLDSQLEQIEEDSRAKTLKRLKDFMEKTDATSPHETTHTPVSTKKKQQKAVQRNLFVEDKMEQINPDESSDAPVVKKKKQQKKAMHRDLTAEGETDQTTASQEITESPAVKKKRQQKNVQKESMDEGVEDETSPEESSDPPVVKKKKQQKPVPNKDSANDGAMEHIVEEDESTDAPVVKKQQKKTQARKTTEGKTTTTKRGPKGKPPQNQEDRETERSPVSAEQQIKQDALLLLRGHKQPQLKVYKLDPSKAACTTADPPPQDPPTDPQETQEPPDGLAGRTKGKGGRPKKSQKRLTLLASVPVSSPPPPAQTPASKPKTTRKRKNPNVETEGIITSRHALQCKDCGQRFSQLSTLQGHKAVVHAVESPGLTYTNGNVFEGVSSHMHLCPDPQSADGEGGVMTAAVTDWDTEAEAGDAAAPGSVSFPDLNVSPSLPAPGLEGGGHPLAPPGAQGPPQYPAGPQGPPQYPAGPQGPPQYPAGPQGPTQSLSIPPVALSPGCLKSDQIQTAGSDRRSPPCLTSVSPALPGAAEGLSASGKHRTKERGGDPDEDGSLPGPPTTGPPEGQGGTAADEDVKEDLLLEVDLVTVGDPNEREEEGVDGSQKESVVGGGGGPSADAGNPGVAPPAAGEDDEEEKATEMNSTSQTVRQPHVKEEEEETPVEPPPSRGAGGRRGGARGRRGGGGRRGRNGAARRRSLEDGDTARGAEKECQVLYQQYPLDAGNSDMKDEGVETAAAVAAVVRPDEDEPQTTARRRGSSSQPRVHLGTPVTVQPDRTPSKPPSSSSSSVPPPPPPPSPPRVEQAAEEEQEVFELEPVSTSVDQLQDAEADQTSRSPALILERFLTARHRNHQDRDAEYEEQVMRMKMEQSGSDPQGVKQENHQSSGPGRHRRWRAEDPEPSAAAADSDPSPGATDLASRQCIFYPVKQEEREELLEDTPTGGDAPRHTDHHSAAEDDYDGSPEVEGLEGSGLNGGGSEHMEEEGETDAEWHSAPHLQDFLLQSSDEEDGDLCDLSDPQPEQEAHTMTSYYCKDRSSSHDSSSSHSVSPPSERPSPSTQPIERPSPSTQPIERPSPSTQPIERPSPSTQPIDSPSTQPIDYFSRYLSRDTWVEMAQCTNRLSKLPSQPTTAREVAQFVGIHIAMGTLKFPSPRLYWQDLTRVPLVAEAMPLSRFLQLCHKLRLASRPPGGAPTSPLACNGSAGGLNPARASQQSGEPLDPLWKVQALLGRFQAACRQLSKEHHYGVDQYPVPLTAGGPRGGRRCLHGTVLLGPGGLVHHLELTSDLQDKEATVERLVTSDLQVPQGSMVFLCKQQLSTPAMLERLLASGVHCAGKVGGGAREGQIGDQFVSSDGRLVLRRAQRGFILATAGSGGQPGMAGSGQPGMAGSGGQPGMAALLQSFQRAQRGARLNRELQGLYRTPSTSPACCWPQAVLWYLVDLALVNAWLQYRQELGGDGSEPLSFMSFRLEVSKTLILSPSSSSSAATDPQDSVPPRRPPPPAPPPPQKAHHQASERSPPNPGPPALQRGSGALPDAATRYDGAGHWPEQLGEGEEGGRCRFGGCERTSRVMCLKCCVFLCISRHHNCFLGFHSRGAS